MRIFVTGATGFVGSHVAADLERLGHAPIRATREDFDLEAPSIPVHADAVVHCAAVATVAACDADPERATRLNVAATRTLAIEAARRRIPLVFTSTDLVFDGGAAPYDESATPSPATHYGRTKAEAERAVREADPGHVVLRLALVVGAHQGRPGGFLAWLVDALAARRPVPLYVNQIRAPLFVGDVAPIVHAAIVGELRGGTYHLASERGLSREAIGRRVARAFGLSEDGIVPTVLARAPTLPAIDDCTLRTTALEVRFTPLEEALSRVSRTVLAGERGPPPRV